MYYPGDEGKLLYILNHYKVGVGVSIHIKESFISYSSGVYDDPSCPNEVNSNNHALVGLFTMKIYITFFTFTTLFIL